MRKLFIILVLAVLPFLLISLFVNPLYDDFSYSNNVLREGIFNAQIKLYDGWAGRYFSNILLSLNPIILGYFTLYKVVPVVLIGLTFLSFYGLINALLGESLERNAKLLAGLFLTILFLNGMPDTLDGIYWIPGSMSYQLANILTLFFLALMWRTLENSNRFKILPLFGSVILIIAIVGSSETSMLFLVFIVGSITALSFFQKSKTGWIWLGLLILAILCSYLVISSPGNEIRGAAFANRHRLIYSVAMAAAQEVRFLAAWLANPVFILSTILSVPMLAKILEKRELLKNHFDLHPIIPTVLWLGLLFCGFFPPYWATGILGQHRSVNVSYFFFLIGWFWLLVNWMAFFKKQAPEIEFTLPKFVYLLGLPLLVLCLFATNNSKEAVLDLITGTAFRYDREMKARYQEFEQCVSQNQAVCQVSEIQNLPVTISRKNYFNPISFRYEQDFWRLRRPKESGNENNQ